MELIERIKRDVRFDMDEVKAITISALILGFVFAFAELSLFNFITAVLIVLVSITVHVFAQKAAGVIKGVSVKYKLWWYGLIASLILAFITNGKIWWLIVPGGFTAAIIAKYRIGKFRFGLNYRILGTIGLIGPIASIILGSIFMNINLYTPLQIALFQKIFIWNIVYAVWCILPIPPLDGHHTFFAGRPSYVFTTGIIGAYCLLILLLGVYSWIWAVIGGVLIWAIYLFKFEIGTW